MSIVVVALKGQMKLLYSDSGPGNQTVSLVHGRNVVWRSEVVASTSSTAINQLLDFSGLYCFSTGPRNLRSLSSMQGVGGQVLHSGSAYSPTCWLSTQAGLLEGTTVLQCGRLSEASEKAEIRVN